MVVDEPLVGGVRACLSGTVCGWRTSIPTCHGCRVNRSGCLAGDGLRLRRHVPDFLLETTNGFVVVVVKPAELVNDADIAAVMSWTRRLCDAKGWGYEVWSGVDLVLLRNIRFPATVRRERVVADDAVGKVAAVARPGMTIAQVETAASIEITRARPALLTLLWTRRWSVDLSCPLTGSSVLQAVA